MHNLNLNYAFVLNYYFLDRIFWHGKVQKEQKRSLHLSHQLLIPHHPRRLRQWNQRYCNQQTEEWNRRGVWSIIAGVLPSVKKLYNWIIPKHSLRLCGQEEIASSSLVTFQTHEKRQHLPKFLERLVQELAHLKKQSLHRNWLIAIFGRSRKQTNVLPKNTSPVRRNHRKITLW